MLVSQHAPNRILKRYTAAGTSWVLIASDGTAHASLSALQSAGKTPFPGIEGAPLQYLSLRSENGANADGSPFLYAFNRTTAPSDDEADLVSGSGMKVTEPGAINFVWLKKTVSGDEIILHGGY